MQLVKIAFYSRYESRLSTERDNCVRLQGENGLLRQKFQSALKDVTQLQDQMKALETVKKNLQNVSTSPLHRSSRPGRSQEFLYFHS